MTHRLEMCQFLTYVSCAVVINEARNISTMLVLGFVYEAKHSLKLALKS